MKPVKYLPLFAAIIFSSCSPKVVRPTTARIQWMNDNGETVKIWDGAIIKTTITSQHTITGSSSGRSYSSGSSHSSINLSGQTKIPFEAGNFLSFQTSDGKNLSICGGLTLIEIEPMDCNEVLSDMDALLAERMKLKRLLLETKSGMREMTKESPEYERQKMTIDMLTAKITSIEEKPKDKYGYAGN